MATTETKTEGTYYPPFYAIQNDWNLSLTNNNGTADNDFWISLIQHQQTQNQPTSINATVHINTNKTNQLIPKLTIKTDNNDIDSKQNDNLDWTINIHSISDDNKQNNPKYYSETTCSQYNLDNYRIIPSYNQITYQQQSKVSINCLDIAKSSYFKREYICSGLENGNINIYDIESSKLKMNCTGHNGSITQCKFFPFGDLILSGDTKGVLNIYAIADPKGKPAVNFEGHKGDISCINFIGEGSQIVSGSRDNTVILWDCSTQKQVIQFGSLGLSTINQIDLIKNDKILTSVSTDGYLKFYDITNGKDIINIKEYNGNSIECFSILNDNCIIIANDNGMCYIYDIRMLNENKINCICKIQRDEKCIKKMIKCNENELILSNPAGSIWKWKLDINKDININNVNTIMEWTGNDQFGVNDFVITNDDKKDNKMYVATKNYKIKEYMLL
eukprot:247267_1